MFHVERTLRSRIITGTILVFAAFMIFGCASQRNRMTIPDYVILPNGKQVLGTEPLHAFVFENTQNHIYFQKYLAAKFDLVNQEQKDIWVTINGTRYKLLVYENAELEKYFQVSDFIITAQHPQMEDKAPQANFFAISMLSERNEDCLSENSLLQNTAIQFLKNLKDDYLKQ